MTFPATRNREPASSGPPVGSVDVRRRSAEGASDKAAAKSDEPRAPRRPDKKNKPDPRLRTARSLLGVGVLGLIAAIFFTDSYTWPLSAAVVVAVIAILMVELHLRSRKNKPRKLPVSYTEPFGGSRKLLWKGLLQPLYNLRGWKWTLLEPSQDEQIARARKELQQITDGPNGVQAIIVEANQKGGSGKSTDSASSGCTIGEVTGQSICVFDNNQTKGNTASRLGVTETLTVRDAMRLLGSKFTHADAIRHLGHHPRYRNVFVIDSDKAEARKNQPIESAPFRAFALELKKQFHTVLFDFGNNLDAVQTEVANEVADVLRFVAVPWIENSVPDCRDTMEHFRTTHPDKVANSVIVISGHKKGDPDAEYYADYFDHPVEQIVLIPFDPVFRPLRTKGSPEEQVRVVDHRNFGKRTQLANLRRDILTYTQARKNLTRQTETASSGTQEGH